MAILTKIDGVPLFSTIQEALASAFLNKITGYHTHTYKNRIGYMAGTDHSQVTGRVSPAISSVSRAVQAPIPTTAPRPLEARNTFAQQQSNQTPIIPQQQQVLQQRQAVRITTPQPTPPPQYNTGGGGGGGY
tara:strand:- start:103 stop:498 length:396 start_codon:yes stop_codon:yes gene_type:complete